MKGVNILPGGGNIRGDTQEFLINLFHRLLRRSDF